MCSSVCVRKFVTSMGFYSLHLHFCLYKNRILLDFFFIGFTKYFFFLQGATFAEVIEMTDIFEGSIIRQARRLDEFLNQVTRYMLIIVELSCFQ